MDISSIYGRNVFCIHSVMGSKIPSCRFIEDVDILNHYLTSMEVENVDWSEKYDINQIQYVDVLYTIDLTIFKELTADLIRIYRKYRPYATEQNFKDEIFGGTIYALQNFLTNKCINSYRGEVLIDGAPTSGRSVYSYIDVVNSEWIVFIAEEDKDIDHYIQYFNAVLRFIENISFSEPDNNISSIPQSNDNEHKTDDKKAPIHIAFDAKKKDKFYELLCAYFEGQETQLNEAFNNKPLTKKIIYAGFKNALSEVFIRAKYNGVILNGYPELCQWVCDVFTTNKGDFEYNYVYEVYTKADDKEPKENKRLCNDNDLLLYKPRLHRE